MRAFIVGISEQFSRYYVENRISLLRNLLNWIMVMVFEWNTKERGFDEISTYEGIFCMLK